MPSSSPAPSLVQRRCRCHSSAHANTPPSPIALLAQGVDVSQWCRVCADAACAVLHQAVHTTPNVATTFLYLTILLPCPGAVGRRFQRIVVSVALSAPLHTGALAFFVRVYECVTFILQDWSAPSYNPDAAERARALAVEEGGGACAAAKVTARRCQQMLHRI